MVVEHLGRLKKREEAQVRLQEEKFYPFEALWSSMKRVSNCFLHGLWSSRGASGDAWRFDELVALQVPGLVHLEGARFLWF